MQGNDERSALPSHDTQSDAASSIAGADPDQATLVVTVVVRARTPIPTDIALFAPLTREQFLAQYGADEQDMAAVETYFKLRGLATTQHKHLRIVALYGTLQQIEYAFGTTMVLYEQQSAAVRGNPSNYFGCNTLSKHLADRLETVLGLDDPPQNSRADTANGYHNGNGVPLADARLKLDTPAAVAAYYNFPAGDGAGECIGIIELTGGYRHEDINTYFDGLGIEPRPDVTDVAVQSPTSIGANRPYADADKDTVAEFARWMNGQGRFVNDARRYSEVTMDISMLGALAPKAIIRVFFSGDTVRALLFNIGHALFCTEPQPSVLSISWGFSERTILNDNSAKFAAGQINNLFLAAAHMGVTVCCASGDWGASNEIADSGHGSAPGTLDVTFPASSPYALACGGTTILADGSEVVWNADFPPNLSPSLFDRNCKHGATGGGFSHIFARPVWQPPHSDPGVKTPDASVMADMRWLPDVAAVADPQCGMRFALAGESALSGGTSASAPLWAALVARLNQKLGRRVGCLSPLLYAHAVSESGVLKDITVGNNRFGKDDVGFDASPAWDACTGFGTPNGEALLALLKSLAPSP